MVCIYIYLYVDLKPAGFPILLLRAPAYTRSSRGPFRKMRISKIRDPFWGVPKDIHGDSQVVLMGPIGISV